MNLNEYRVTFGQQYSHEPHPTWTVAHPDGWLTIVARDEAEARRAAFRVLSTAWSDLNVPRPDDESLYPRGELHRIKASSLDMRMVTVCSECLSEMCWEGNFMCEAANGASTVQVPAWQARGVWIHPLAKRKEEEADGPE